MKKIGLIAGNRKLPILFSQAAKRNNYDIVAVAIKGDTSRDLVRFVDKIYWLKVSEFSRMFEIFKAEGVTNIAMLGQISPQRLFSKEVNKNEEIQNILRGIKDKKADTLFGAIAGKLKDAGFVLLDSTLFIKDLLPERGTLTQRKPDAGEWEDIHFGLDLAKRIADLGIGQTVAVKLKAVVAVEALEGTDNLIRRAGKIAGAGSVIIKVSKPEQDMRFDLPVVGLATIKNLTKVGATCLAIESGKTIFIDQAASIKLADQKNISIVAV